MERMKGISSVEERGERCASGYQRERYACKVAPPVIRALRQAPSSRCAEQARASFSREAGEGAFAAKRERARSLSPRMRKFPIQLARAADTPARAAGRAGRCGAPASPCRNCRRRKFRPPSSKSAKLSVASRTSRLSSRSSFSTRCRVTPLRKDAIGHRRHDDAVLGHEHIGGGEFGDIAEHVGKQAIVEAARIGLHQRARIVRIEAAGLGVDRHGLGRRLAIGRAGDRHACRDGQRRLIDRQAETRRFRIGRHRVGPLRSAQYIGLI